MKYDGHELGILWRRQRRYFEGAVVNTGLESILTPELRAMRPELHQRSIPALAKDPDSVARIRDLLARAETTHEVVLGDAVNRLSGRDASAWAAGVVEVSAIVEVDFAEAHRVVAAPDMSAFFNRLASRVRDRNPDRFVAESGA